MSSARAKVKTKVDAILKLDINTKLQKSLWHKVLTFNTRVCPQSLAGLVITLRCYTYTHHQYINNIGLNQTSLYFVSVVSYTIQIIG